MKLSTTSTFLGLAIIVLISTIIDLPILKQKKAQAQSYPLCRDVTPQFNQVCYKDIPYSARQRDEGGTRNHSFIVERVGPNYVIIDFDVIKDSGFGATSRPTGSVLSSTGNASIINVTNRETQNLSEVRTKLSAQINGCKGSVCGNLRQQLNTVNRTIEKLENYNRTAINAGGNEKIVFNYTTSVRCDNYFGVKVCKGGASITGRVRVYYRYLGNPSSIAEEARKVAQQAQLALSTTPQQTTYSLICIKNTTNLNLNYQGKWSTDSNWFKVNLKPGQSWRHWRENSNSTMNIKFDYDLVQGGSQLKNYNLKANIANNTNCSSGKPYKFQYTNSSKKYIDLYRISK